MKGKRLAVIVAIVVVLVGAFGIGVAESIVPHSQTLRFSGTVMSVAYPDPETTSYSVAVECHFTSGKWTGPAYLVFELNDKTVIQDALDNSLAVKDLKKGDEIEALVDTICSDSGDPHTIAAVSTAKSITVKS